MLIEDYGCRGTTIKTTTLRNHQNARVGPQALAQLTTCPKDKANASITAALSIPKGPSHQRQVLYKDLLEVLAKLRSRKKNLTLAGVHNGTISTSPRKLKRISFLHECDFRPILSARSLFTTRRRAWLLSGQRLCMNPAGPWPPLLPPGHPSTILCCFASSLPSQPNSGSILPAQPNPIHLRSCIKRAIRITSSLERQESSRPKKPASARKGQGQGLR